MFTRSSHNPILAPSGQWWETRGVLNPGAVLYNGRIALVYRAVGADGISRLGLAWTTNGERIDGRLPFPFYEGGLDDPLARLGVEDPRITPLDGEYYLTYCKVSLEPATTPPLSWEFAPFRLRSAISVTTDFTEMRETALLVPHANTKDAVLFPERINGRYAALVREYPSIQYVTSPDLAEWSEPEFLMGPVPGTWQAERIGAGPPPIRTPWGWLLIYHANEYLHAAGNKRLYRLGFAVLHADEPTKVLYRHPDPIFSPEESFEMEGPVGNVVFGTGLVLRDDTYYLYYGAGDGVIGLATATRDAIEGALRQALGPAL